jgi:uncharacterized protein (DUF58 family)
MAVAATTTMPPADKSVGGSRSFLDPQALMSVRNLELRARTVVEGFWHGMHRSPYHGFSVEFTEYRPYTPGDDPRYLDETNLRCHLLVDNSRSMDYGSRGYTKADYANTLAATLAWFLHHQGDAVGLLTFDESIREFFPARNRPGHLRHLMLALEKPAAGSATDLAAPLKRIAEIVRKRGLMVLLSDLLAPIESLENNLALLTAAGHEVIVFQLFDRAELDFTFDKPSLFQDVESGRELYLEPDVARRDYQKKLAAHIAAVRGACDHLGISHHQLATDQPLDVALFDFLKVRMQRGKVVKRNVR